MLSPCCGVETESVIKPDLAARTGLAQPLVDDRTDRNRLVQTPLAGHHWQTQAAVRVSVEDLVGQAGGLATEDQGISQLEVDIPYTARRAGREQPEPGRAVLGQRIDAGFPIRVLPDAEPGPIVEASPSTGLLVGIETERVDQMERAARRDAGATDVAGIVGDLRLV